MGSRVVSDATTTSIGTTRVITPTQTGTPKLTVTTPRRDVSAITARQPSSSSGCELTRDHTWSGPSASSCSGAGPCGVGPDAQELSSILESSLSSRLTHNDTQLCEEFDRVQPRKSSADSVFEAELGGGKMTTINPLADDNEHGRNPLTDCANQSAPNRSSQLTVPGAQVVQSRQARWLSTHCRRLSHALSVASLYEKQNTTRTPTYDRSPQEPPESILEDTAVNARTLQAIEQAQELSMTARLKNKLENAKLKLTEQRAVRGLGFIRLRSPSQKLITTPSETQYALPDARDEMLAAEPSSMTDMMRKRLEPLVGDEKREILEICGDSWTQDAGPSTTETVEHVNQRSLRDESVVSERRPENYNGSAQQSSLTSKVRRATRCPRFPPGAWSRSGYEPKKKKEERKSSHSGDWRTRFFLPL